MPVTGLTHFDTNDTVTLSAYRFHEMYDENFFFFFCNSMTLSTTIRDPILFKSGLLIHWRIGDTVDPSGLKCYSQTGDIVGSPTASHVTSYAWVYVW